MRRSRVHTPNPRHARGVDEVRSDGAQFLVDEEHVNHQVERIVERRRCYALVEKVKPLVRRTVLRLDPRTAENA